MVEQNEAGVTLADNKIWNKQSNRALSGTELRDSGADVTERHWRCVAELGALGPGCRNIVQAAAAVQPDGHHFVSLARYWEEDRNQFTISVECLQL